MGLLAQARQDIAAITTDLEGFGVSMLLVAPNGETATVTGLHSKRRLAVLLNGEAVNSKVAHVSFSEAVVLAANPDYPIRRGLEVNLFDHKVTVKDSTNTDCTYVLREWFPDETLGLITCILGDYE